MVLFGILTTKSIQNNHNPHESSTSSTSLNNAQVAQTSNTYISLTVFAFFYDWYSAPSFTKNYGHWDGGGSFKAPDDIESNYYPYLNPYSSNNPTVLETQMKWAKKAGIDVLILSWWGKGDYTDQNVPLILRTANATGLKICFMIEPYPSRTIQSVVSDIKYIYNQYGNYPSFYKTIRPTLYGNSKQKRGLFFIYALDGGEKTSQAFDSLRHTAWDGIFLGQMDDSKMFKDSSIREELSYSHLDGLFNYSEYPNWSTSDTWPKSKDYLLVYSIIPGWDHSRIVSQKNIVQARQLGKYYDDNWKEILKQKPEAVSILSFNEWHEGTQIEPAVPHKVNNYKYNNYLGTYGLNNKDSPFAYINRTTFWSKQYKQ